MSQTIHEPAAQRLAMLDLSHVRPKDGFNPRSKREKTAFTRLRASVARRGVLQPLLVVPDPDHDDGYVIVAGESRYLAAVDAELAQVPCLIDIVDAETDGLDDALVENLLREDLSPLDEARAFRRLRDGGLAPRGIAQRVGRSVKFVRDRLALLDLSDELHAQVEDGTIPLGAVPALLMLGKIHPELPAIGVRRVLDGPVRSWDDPTTWEDLAADPVAVVIGSTSEQRVQLPAGVYVGGTGYPATSFTLDQRAVIALDRLAELLDVPVSSLEVRFDGEMVEQAAALSAAFPTKNGYEHLIVGADVAAQLAGDQITARLKTERARVKRERDARRAQADTAASVSRPDEADAKQPTEDEQRELKRRVRDEAKKAALRARSYNVLLGAQLVKHLARVKIDERVLKILTAAPLAVELEKIAARGARIAFPGWPIETTLRNRSVKVTYLQTYEAAARAHDYLAGASKAGEIAGRSLALLAAARWADETALPMSRRVFYEVSFDRRAHCVPWGEEAGELLDDLLIEKLPPEVTEPIRAAKHEREKHRDEQRQLEAERAHAVAELVEQASTMTLAERETEIGRLQRDYGYDVLDAHARKSLAEQPEPSGDDEASSSDDDGLRGDAEAEQQDVPGTV